MADVHTPRQRSYNMSRIRTQWWTEKINTSKANDARAVKLLKMDKAEKPLKSYSRKL